MDNSLSVSSALLNQVTSALGLLYPELVLMAFFVLVVLADLFFENKNIAWLLTTTALMLSSGLVVATMPTTKTYFMFQSVRMDSTIALFKVLLLLCSLLFMLYVKLFYNKIGQENVWFKAEIYSILLAMILGLNFMMMSNNMLIMYLALETVSISFYILVALKNDSSSIESGLKYLLFGIISSAVMLYGLSLFYGLTGTLQFQNILASSDIAMIVLCFFILVGLFFKLSIFPFHFWVSDTYQGTSGSILSLLSVLPKIAALLTMLNLLIYVSPKDSSIFLANTIGTTSIITMTIGNLAALVQKNLKQIFAYSSVAHAGFIILTLIPLQNGFTISAIYYLMVYAAMNMSVFFMIDFLENKFQIKDVTQLSGFATQQPLLSVLLVVLMISFTGLPPTVGFWAKFFVFAQLYQGYQHSGEILYLYTLIFALLNTAFALFYYLKIPYYLYFKTKQNELKYELKNWEITFFVCLILPLLLMFFVPNISSNLINFISK